MWKSWLVITKMPHKSVSTCHILNLKQLRIWKLFINWYEVPTPLSTFISESFCSSAKWRMWKKYWVLLQGSRLQLSDAALRSRWSASPSWWGTSVHLLLNPPLLTGRACPGRVCWALCVPPWWRRKHDRALVIPLDHNLLGGVSVS